MTDWLSKLNDQQRKAATHVEGPLFVVAGAGTGKTRTLTTRVAYLIEQAGISPESILAVTFTNKAAREMKERIIDMAGPHAVKTWIYTFHAFGVQVLREFIDRLNQGYKKNFNIIDEDDAKAIIRDLIKSQNLDNKQYKVNDIRNKISDYKYFKEDKFDDYHERNIYQLYQKNLVENNLLDFDDLQVLTHELLLTDEVTRTYYQNKFQYILVDEFQDTDHIQYEIIKLLGMKHRNVFVVGDPDQSIYGFRGADYNNANKFMKDFGNQVVLDLNYRSTTHILSYANRLIKRNQNRPFEKDLKSNLGDGIEPVIWSAQSDFNEANMVANEIKRLVSDYHYNYEDIAILYRNNALSRTFEDTMMKHNIPYVMYGGISFYQRKEIKDVLAYIRVLLNPNLDFYFKRIINVPKRAIGPTSVQKLEAKAKELKISMFEAIDHIDFSGKAKDALHEFKSLILEMSDKLNYMESLEEIVMYVAYHSGYIAMLEEEKDDISEDRIDNIKELKSVFVQGEQFYEGNFVERLQQLLDQIALYSDLDKADDRNAIKLSTFHQVKGLEFKVVFMTVMEDEIFPSPLSTFDPKDLEEERRIAYVGVTRAKERLYLTRSESRLLYGNWMNPSPSRFLKEMRPVQEVFTSRKFESSPTQKNTTFLNAGDKVNHIVFGEGIVVGVEDGIATIAFKMPHGIKKLLENHPSIKKI
ncbi:ATP-dependent helicase [Acholeplasma hippikon]|uniref:DNA 3'-5' helicase n=1 Tax=Acholeplasma hippikon TaxID=264636 RepID=A0A449BKU4_9MOLU|nr:UvrD-helicase domain-containing protein [Acholeplasma hippikon]VEU83095.1 ATP-dependent DNA helicase UvrD/PcrA [Acholeplasma hippikon]